MVYSIKEHDLSQYDVVTEDGTAGWIYDNHIQEIDIATGESDRNYFAEVYVHRCVTDNVGEVVFTWSALDYIDSTQGYVGTLGTGVSQKAAWDFLVRQRPCD